MGNISLHLLEECFMQRWQYFQGSNKETNKLFCQYIIEGSAYDNIGHFMLTFLSKFSKDKNLINIVTQTEETLFFKRIQCASPTDLRILCKHVLKVTNDSHPEVPPYFDILGKLCNKMVIKHIAQHVSEESHDVECNTYSIDSHFKMCLPLVATRQVELHNGIATIPCGKWKMFFKTLFHIHLTYRNDNTKLTDSNDIDPRWRELIFKLTQTICNKSNVSKTALKYTEIDEKSKIFPPCMKNLHSSLRNKHRLSHNERFRYSLFLKDVGMPMQQSLYFWQREYSKPCHQKSACTHEWDKDSSKYIYGIRHLYGLEGSRKNYCMVGCTTIQSRASNEGGCPFKHFDEKILKKHIDLNVVTGQNWCDILHSVKLKKPTEACNLYKNAIISHIKNNCKSPSSVHIVSTTNSPVSFFNEINAII